MTPNEQFVTTLEKLLERSRKNEVNWQRAGENEFEVTFLGSPRTTISVEFYSPKAAPDWYCAELSVGREVAITLNAENTDEEYGTDLFSLLRNLWIEAERSVVKWDRSLEMVNKALETEKTVGVASVPDDDGGF